MTSRTTVIRERPETPSKRPESDYVAKAIVIRGAKEDVDRALESLLQPKLVVDFVCPAPKGLERVA